MRRWVKDSGLVLIVFGIFLVAPFGQSLTGLRVYNQNQTGHNQPTIGYLAYLQPKSFIEVTFENWESEFLQMAAYVFLTVFLLKKGSVKSKDPEETDPVDEDPTSHAVDPDLPWPVRKGG